MKMTHAEEAAATVRGSIDWKIWLDMATKGSKEQAWVSLRDGIDLDSGARGRGGKPAQEVVVERT